ncbi:uncharacterized protein LOC116619440 [Nematostella vectensis]|uniref:uncharacterized protein LOC116619440 n=1 Tax=Nematostella vectensis TaxID=45351 RepID=UPI002077673D|nr:uncharacterized protein LOC116619440 [Nematostella vectensis]
MEMCVSWRFLIVKLKYEENRRYRIKMRGLIIVFLVVELLGGLGEPCKLTPKLQQRQRKSTITGLYGMSRSLTVTTLRAHSQLRKLNSIPDFHCAEYAPIKDKVGQQMNVTNTTMLNRGAALAYHKAVLSSFSEEMAGDSLVITPQYVSLRRVLFNVRTVMKIIQTAMLQEKTLHDSWSLPPKPTLTVHTTSTGEQLTAKAALNRVGCRLAELNSFAYQMAADYHRQARQLPL